MSGHHRRQSITNDVEASNTLVRDIKSEAGPVSRSVFSHIKISSHHIHKWEEINSFPGSQSKVLHLSLCFDD